MIQDAGFAVETNGEIPDYLQPPQTEQEGVLLKELQVLRPRMESST